MKMRNTLTTGILFLLSLTLIAQPSIDWQNSLGGTQQEFGSDILETNDGGYIVVGSSKSNNGDVTSNNGSADFWIVKLLSNGTIEWEKSYGGSGDDFARSVQQTSDGGYIVAGSSASNDGDVTGNHGNLDCWVVKLSNLGQLEWQKSFGGSSSEEVNSVKQTFDGGYIFTGYTSSIDGDVSSNNGGTDMWVVKLTSTGSMSWEKNLGGSVVDIGTSILEIGAGSYIVVGHTRSDDGDVGENKGAHDIWVLRLGSTGGIAWQKSFGGSFDDFSKSIEQTTDGGYIVGGQTASVDGDVTFNHGANDLWIIKLTSVGNPVWTRAIGGQDSERSGTVSQVSDGGYIVAGSSESSSGQVTVNNGFQDIWLAKLTDQGILSWQKSIGGQYGEFNGAGIKQTSDGGFIVTGTTNSSDGNVSGYHGGGDCWVVKLSAAVGLYEDAKESAFSVYPNPSIDEVNLELTTEMIGFNYTIHDYTGRTILIGEIKNENTFIDVSNLSEGIYVVRIPTVKGNLTARFEKR